MDGRLELCAQIIDIFAPFFEASTFFPRETSSPDKNLRKKLIQPKPPFPSVGLSRSHPPHPKWKPPTMPPLTF